MGKITAFFLVCLTVLVLISGCTDNSGNAAAQTAPPTPQPVITQPTAIPTTLTGWVYNSTSGTYTYVPTAAQPEKPASVTTQTIIATSKPLASALHAKSTGDVNLPFTAGTSGEINIHIFCDGPCTAVIVPSVSGSIYQQIAVSGPHKTGTEVFKTTKTTGDTYSQDVGVSAQDYNLDVTANSPHTTINVILSNA